MMVIIFFISPEAIINFFGGSYRGGGSTYYPPDTLTYSYIVQNEIRDPISGILIMIHVLSLYFDMSSVQINYFFLSIILMSIITILIHSCKSLSIEKKFGLWALLSLFFYGFTQNRYFVGLLPLIALLLTDREIIESRRLIEFLRKNFLTILGLTCLLTLYLMPPVFYLARLFPFIQYIPIVLMFLRYIFIYLIIVLVVMLLHKEEILNLKNSIAKLRNQKKTNENE